MRDRPYHVLLDLEIEEPDLGERVPDRLGFSTYPGTIVVSSSQGRESRRYGPGLEGWSLPARSADLYGRSGTSEGAGAVSLALGAAPVLEWLNLGVRLQRIRCRLWWWRKGDTQEASEEVWVGFLRNPQIDVNRGVFRFSIASGTREVDGALPPGRIGDEGRFPSAPDTAKPYALPVIYGLVRNVPAYRVSDDPGASPPAAATNVRFLVCGHETPAFPTRLTDGADMLGPLQFAQLGRDGRGNAYTYIDVPNTTPGWSDAAAYYVLAALGWKDTSDRSAGSSLEGAIDRLGDVLIHLVTTYARERFYELDRTRIYAARSLLNRYLVGAVINDPQGGSVLRILKSRFESQFPVVFNTARGRFGWDYAGLPPVDAEPSGTLVWGVNAHERGVVAPVPLDLLRSRFEVAWGIDTNAGGTTSSVRRDETNSGPCRASAERWGSSVVQRIDAPDVTDEATARLLIEDQIRRLTVRRIRVSYVVDDVRWLSLPLFSRVLVTDPDMEWSDKPCLVESLAPIRPGRIGVGLITEDGL